MFWFDLLNSYNNCEIIFRSYLFSYKLTSTSEIDSISNITVEHAKNRTLLYDTGNFGKGLMTNELLSVFACQRDT